MVGLENPAQESIVPSTEGTLSVRSSFKGKNVFITGITGYVGSLVLEQLLRVCPDVGRVYVLIRGKRNQTAKQRLEGLLSSGLFNQLWEHKDILHKIKIVEGDITQDDLGFDTKDRDEMLENVNFVIHSAAAVALDDPIKKTLRNNYLSTLRILELCQKMSHLESYAHVSTAFVNITHESGSVVKEEIYPLVKGDLAVSHVDITTEIMRLSDEDAQLKAIVLMDRFNFPNTYCIGKRLTEELVTDYFKKGLPCSIIRPSLITGVDQGSYPGYIGNLAGGAGFAIAFAVGFFEDYSCAWSGNGVCDIVPGNVVSSVVLAAAASAATCRVKENEISVFHACTSSSYPISNVEMYGAAYRFFTKEPPPYCLLWGSYPSFPITYKPNPTLVYLAKMRTAVKVRAICWFLRRMGKDRLAKRLYVGWKAWDFGNQERYDMNLFFSVDNVRKLDDMLVKEERSSLQLLFTPVNGNWSRYMRTYLAGIKSLLLKTPLKDSSDHDFRMIASLDPPLELPNCIESKPSKPLQPEEPPHVKSLARRTSSCVSASALAALGRSISGVNEILLGDEAELEEEEEVVSDGEAQSIATAGIVRIPSGIPSGIPSK